MTYRVGQAVLIAAREHEGHHRTPAYLKGRRARVERVHTSFTNPESRAYGGDGLPEQQLYLVSVPQHELWSAYRGPAADRLCVDVFEHWLEEAE